MEEVRVRSEVLNMVSVSYWVIFSFVNPRGNKVQEIICSQSLQTFFKLYLFMFISANLKWFPTKLLKEFVYTTKFCSTRDNSCCVNINGIIGRGKGYIRSMV